MFENIYVKVDLTINLRLKSILEGIITSSKINSVYKINSPLNDDKINFITFKITFNPLELKQYMCHIVKLRVYLMKGKNDLNPPKKITP